MSRETAQTYVPIDNFGELNGGSELNLLAAMAGDGVSLGDLEVESEHALSLASEDTKDTSCIVGTCNAQGECNDPVEQ